MGVGLVEEEKVKSRLLELAMFGYGLEVKKKAGWEKEKVATLLFILLSLSLLLVSCCCCLLFSTSVFKR